MLSEEIRSVHLALGNLAGKIAPEEYELVRLCRRNLLAAECTAREMETRLETPEFIQPAAPDAVQ